MPRILLFWAAAISYIALGHASVLERGGTQGQVACDQLTPPTVDDAKVISFSAGERLNLSGPVMVVDKRTPHLEIITGLDVCTVNVTLTHPGVEDKVNIEVWLPLKGWNGRFQGLGGAGWIAGVPGFAGMAYAVNQGFAAAITTGGDVGTAQGQFNPDMANSASELQFGRMTDFASRSLHELAVVGKDITAKLYKKPAAYSYWNGCSTGGRQGYSLAQKYPNDFNGILAQAPAVGFIQVLLNLGWAQFVTRWKKHHPSACALKGFQTAATAKCDQLDGVKDDVISDTAACRFDPHSVTGTNFTCGNETVTLSAKDADVLVEVHSGPFGSSSAMLSPAYPWGINYTAIFRPDDATSGFFSTVVKKDPKYDLSKLVTLEEFTEWFAIAQAEAGAILNTDNPDLSAFRASGNKLMTWHGTADEFIPVDNTIRYRKRVEAVMGGSERVDEFYRVFLAPGVAHCWSGNGAYPVDAFRSLMDWVEKNKPPTELHGKMADREATRKMCLYPKVARYNGHGDKNSASSYSCAESYIA